MIKFGMLGVFGVDFVLRKDWCYLCVFFFYGRNLSGRRLGGMEGFSGFVSWLNVFGE